ncbi:exodeoxyribonuclease VII large subunit [Neptuniibacter sp. QD37_11]|uniref:exodeoxyribonuclease VII large subunit n=1 Tax=Neptuniibacter sp. QD37_11 TaxID=3398209 RepID=UPI0039F56FE6
MDSIGLSTLLKDVEAQLKRQFSSTCWVTAEVLRISGSGHKYLELAEYDPSGKQIAKTQATIWKSAASKIFDKFNTATGMQLKSGMKILCNVKVQFSPQYGFSLQMLDIDPNYTLGDMEAKLKEIRDRLANKGLTSLNKQKPLKRDFFKIAVLSPVAAAGLGDFKTQAEILNSRGLCKFDYYEATFQGVNAKQEILSSLRGIYSKLQSDPECYDCLVIIRGGGDKGGLYALNEFEFALAVCHMQIPVITGIGHQQDNTIIDEVAHTRTPTPSLAIAFIKEHIVKNIQAVCNSIYNIDQSCQQLVTLACVQTTSLNDGISSKMHQLIERSATSVAALSESCKQNLGRQTLEAAMQVNLLDSKINACDPRRILDRGFSYIRDSDDSVITSVTDAIGEPNLTIEFKDGKLKVKP